MNRTNVIELNPRSVKVMTRLSLEFELADIKGQIAYSIHHNKGKAAA